MPCPVETPHAERRSAASREYGCGQSGSTSSDYDEVIDHAAIRLR